MTVDQETVGVVGVGTMGRGIVHNLISRGFLPICHDVSETALEAVALQGARVVESPADVAADARLVITMLPTGEDLLDTVFGDGGLIEKASRQTVLLDTSTIEPMVILDVARRSDAAGMSVLDGGVSGSPRMNWDGQATYMVGGSSEILSSIEPVLTSLCGTLIHTGQLGSAKVAKLVNNLMGAVSMAALSEAFNLGIQAGVDPEVLHSSMMSSWARCANLEHMPPVAELRTQHEADLRFPDFSIEYMVKDLSVLIETAEYVGASHRVAGLAHLLYCHARDMGHGKSPIWDVLHAVTDANSDASGRQLENDF